jgi:hypothetical protein
MSTTAFSQLCLFLCLFLFLRLVPVSGEIPLSTLKLGG